MKNTVTRLLAPAGVAAGAVLATPVVALAEESAVGPDILIPKMAEFIPALIAFLVILAVLAAALFLFKKWRKHEPSPIVLILLAAVCGMGLYAIPL